MPGLPLAVKALQNQGNKTLAIPFASQDGVKNLPEDRILLRIHAVGLNPLDWKYAFTAWGTPGTIPGCAAAGDVVAAGSKVTHLKIGDRVCVFMDGGAWQKNNGAFAEYGLFVAAPAFVLPPDMTYEEGASFAGPHLTDVQILYMRLPIPKPLTPEASEFSKKGEGILIWGASTAVGHHAVQLAALSGLVVYATASLSVPEEVKALGATHVYDYKDPEVASKAKQDAGDKGIIYGLDCVCEKGSTEAAIDAMSTSRGGTVMVLLPIGEEVYKRRPDGKIGFTLAGTVVGYELSAFHQPALPEDKARIQECHANDIARVLAGWKSGEGAPQFKTQKLREIKGGLEGVARGLEIMRGGGYRSRETRL